MTDDVKQLRRAYVISYIAMFESLNKVGAIDKKILIDVLSAESKKILADDSENLAGATLHILYAALASHKSDHDAIEKLFRQEENPE